MEHGDFTRLARQYHNRPAYSETVLEDLLALFGPSRRPVVAEIGAGTGKFTRMLLDAGLTVSAVEPSDAMREEGIRYTEGFERIAWHKGTGEHTGLPSASVDWVVMASSFHWTDPERSLPEFHRILKNGGYFTALWNPRNISVSPLHSRIEDTIHALVPQLNRVSSGAAGNTKDWDHVLVSTGHFCDVRFMEAEHVEQMSQARYLGAWESVNDIQVQAGPERWPLVLKAIAREVSHLPHIEVPYKTRAWTAAKRAFSNA